MNRKSLRALVAVNLALLVILGVLTLSPNRADAQAARQRQGDYLMVAGKTLKWNQHVIYITDMANFVVLAVTYEAGNVKRLMPVGFRLFEGDINAAAGAGRPKPR